MKAESAPCGTRPVGRPKVAVLSVSDPFWVSMVSELIGIADLTRVASQTEFEECLSSDVEFDLVLATHWRWRIPEEALRVWRCVGFHSSPLPRGRGGSPIQNQIIRGEYDSEVCAFRVTSEMDAGEIYSRRPVSLKDGNIEEILGRIAALAAEMAREILLGDSSPVPQSGAASVFPRRTPDESHLDLAGLTARQVYDRIRMVDGLDYPRAFQLQGDWALEFTEAELLGDEIVARVSIRPRVDGDNRG